MITDELRAYIREGLASGRTGEDMERALCMAGWQEIDIRDAFEECGIAGQTPPAEPHGKTGARTAVTYSILTGLAVVLGGAVLYLWQDRLDLQDTNTREVRAFYTRLAESQISFTNTGDMVFPDEQEFITQKDRHILDKTSFIEANLKTMEITLYKEGTADKTFRILSKGKERGWWETPTGSYKVLGKALNGYSSIGNVWMPYSVQFYGNYLIHGWPHYDNGEPVPQGYSGGCIRLSNEDAREIFNFSQVNMPVLVLEEHEEYGFGTLVTTSASAPLPSVSAKAFLVSDLSSGEIVLEKRADEKSPIASLTKLMTGVVAHEVIYLGRSIRVTAPMLAGVAQIFSPIAGEYYIGMDLIYPLLMQSSNESAKILAASIGEDVFVRNMNAKAASLGMQDTRFADASGISGDNISTANDLSKMLQYIYYKRPFLFDISKGVIFENIGLLQIGDTVSLDTLKNVNEFVENPDLIGVKNGQTMAAGQTMTTVWSIHTKSGAVPVAIVVLGSEDRKSDTAVLLQWVRKNFETF